MKLFVQSAGLALVLANELLDDPSIAFVEDQGLRNVETFEIFSLLEHIIPDLGDVIPANGLENYGCTGVGNMDPTEKNHGRPIDAIDHALNNRKRCITCAASELGGGYSSYRFHDANNNCGKSTINPKFSFPN